MLVFLCCLDLKNDGGFGGHSPLLVTFGIIFRITAAPIRIK